jgi:thiamine kinase-like enzyme
VNASSRSEGDAARIAEIAMRLGLPGAQVQKLEGGTRNRNYRLEHERGQVVVRLAGSHDADYSVLRDAEWLAQEAAASQSLAPRILARFSSEGVLVSEYVAGQPWSRGYARSAQAAKRIGAWLARLHAVPVPAGLPVVDFAESLEHYLVRLPPGRLSVALVEHARRIAAGRTEFVAAALCHHDLHHLNLIEAPAGIVAVDWEYAGRGAPVMDVAGYAAYHDLDAAATSALLTGYDGPGQAGWSVALADARWLFEAVWLAWLELKRELDGGETDADREERLRLGRRLLAGLASPPHG